MNAKEFQYNDVVINGFVALFVDKIKGIAFVLNGRGQFPL